MTAVTVEGPLASVPTRGYPSNLKRVYGETPRLEVGKDGKSSWFILFCVFFLLAIL